MTGAPIRFAGAILWVRFPSRGAVITPVSELRSRTLAIRSFRLAITAPIGARPFSKQQLYNFQWLAATKRRDVLESREG